MCQWLRRVFQSMPPTGRQFSMNNELPRDKPPQCIVCGTTDGMKSNTECIYCRYIVQANDDELPELQKAARFHANAEWLGWSGYLIHTEWRKRLAFIEGRLATAIEHDKEAESPTETPADNAPTTVETPLDSDRMIHKETT